MLSKNLFKPARAAFALPSGARSFGAMDVVNLEDFEYSFTKKMAFQSGMGEKLKCFRVIDHEGKLVNKEYENAVPKEKLIKIFDNMITINEVDHTFNQAQRQSRISFYMTCTGEEAATIASCAATEDQDMIYPQYREAGALMWRGFTVQDMANQLVGNVHDLGGGKQMPVHYGSRALNYMTVSSPLGTQIPQASGAGYTYRINGDDRIAVTYFGDGAASEGDFHAALNFAQTLKSQTLFICRNNGYAISTPVDDQYGGDGIAARGLGYGMETLRVDGNDALAVYAAVKQARETIVAEKKPVLLELISYRVGDHSTSDFSQRYRDDKEMLKWTNLLAQFSDPIKRLESYLTSKKWIGADHQTKIRNAAKIEVRDALKKAIGEKLPSVEGLFTDVYEELTPDLKEQKAELEAHIRRHPGAYDVEKFEGGAKYL